MNAFSPLRIQLCGRDWLPHAVYPFTVILGLWALSRIPAEPDRYALILSSYALIGAVVTWKLLYDSRADELIALDWDIEHKMMSVLTKEGSWVPVDKLHRRLSLPGVVQLLVVQRRDRGLPTWMWITPDRLSRAEVRRLHVAISFAAPVLPHPATES